MEVLIAVITWIDDESFFLVKLLDYFTYFMAQSESWIFIHPLPSTYWMLRKHHALNKDIPAWQTCHNILRGFQTSNQLQHVDLSMIQETLDYSCILLLCRYQNATLGVCNDHWTAFPVRMHWRCRILGLQTDLRSTFLSFHKTVRVYVEPNLGPSTNSSSEDGWCLQRRDAISWAHTALSHEEHDLIQ